MKKISLKMLTVMLVVGGAVALFLPSWIDAHGKRLEKSAVADIRTLGTALMICLADDSCPEAAMFRERLRSGEGCDDLTPEVAAQLVIRGSDVKPPAAVDPWGGSYELCIEGASESRVMVLRSAGPNGRFETAGVTHITPRADNTQSDGPESDDLVWADGYFVSWPRS